MSEKSKKEAGRKAAKPRAGVAVAARNAARETKKTPVFDDVSPQKKLREALRSLLPRVFADGRLDIDALCESLGESRESVARERYRFEWVGRADSVRLLEQNPALALRPCRGESVDFESTRNLYLEGDNLSILRLLNRAYAGRVKVIYIDPPYNTGNDLVYPDKFGESFAAYEARAGEAESAGAREDSKRNGANRHSFWLSMMFPRLLLARDLLQNDGVIFVSIDDNEVHHLRLLMNAVFGEENVDILVWKKSGDGRYGKMKNVETFRKDHEYVMMAGKDRVSLRKIMAYPNFSATPKKDKKGKFWVGYIARGQNGSDPEHRRYYAVESPTGQKYSAQFEVEKAEFDQLDKDGYIYWSGSGVPYRKIYANEKRAITPSSLIDERGGYFVSSDEGSTFYGTVEVDELFPKITIDAKKIRPKPTALLRALVNMASDEDSIVMDFFAGASTTAHAVMQVNAEDGGKRQCVLAQLPEATDEESEMHKAGFATVADLGKERLRRAGQKIREAKNGDAETDIGFRVFKIAPAVLRRRVSEEKATRQKRLETESAEAQLYEIALAEGLSLTAQIEERKIGKNTVHQISDALNGRRLHICLDSEIATDFPRKPIAEKGETVICRDDAMSDEIALNLSFHYNLKVL